MNNEVANSQSIILNALIAALRNSGNLDVETFKKKIQEQTAPGTNSGFHQGTIDVAIHIAEGGK
ncbi:hypothetical protein ABMZ67_00760 [Pseudomonas aeruginosa]|uniref:hypothetical protein n=1 Tax=Pseudomonas TaxID=286 RepID=UPI0003B9E5D7|nr:MULTISPECIES: hypothetical protein [Pseudomonas]KEA13305.1 hypothetical protein Y905_28165 [Pseudomonas aeruginosa C2159M]MED5476724.1 hypothetical protein [Pseudomonadota bacterium]QGF21345.1 hypothetical protein [Pseudomonas phage AUS531phi]ALY39768.1 hypothetical protein HW09_02460 [Pseudomonas aeruginosa]ALY55749.1 hypothetical protein HW07_20370 [Pseudomonas aeruginosa]